MLDFLRDPTLTRSYEQGAERIELHRAILRAKPMIRGVFEEFYHRIRELDEASFGTTPGLRIELGSGSSLFKEYYPDVVTSDIAPNRFTDRVLDAMKLDLPDQSVRVLYGINCFHHFPDPDRFFHELRRVVRPGGGAILVDPYYGPVASFIFSALFREETFDKQAPGWRDIDQRQKDLANQALSYVVFFRDRQRFVSEYPDLEIVTTEVAPNFLRYVFSGGINFRQLVPTPLTGLLRGFERVTKPIHGVLGLHHTIVLRHRAIGSGRAASTAAHS